MTTPNAAAITDPNDPAFLQPISTAGYDRNYTALARSGRLWSTGWHGSFKARAPYASMHVENPAGSGRYVVIEEHGIHTSVPGDLVYVGNIVSTGEITMNFNHNPQFPQMSVGIFRGGANVIDMSQPTLITLPMRRRVTAGEPQIDTKPYFVGPGQKFAVRFVGVPQAGEVWFNVTFSEAML